MGVLLRRGLALVVPVVLALSGCATDSGTTDGAAPKRSSLAVLAVSVNADKAIALFRVGQDHEAVLLRTVSAPVAGERATSWSLSGGDSPDLCVAWRAGVKGELWCYPFAGHGRAVDLRRPGVPGVVALRPDDRGLAWTVASGTSQDLVTADYHLAVVKHSQVVQKGKDPSAWPDERVLGIAWASDHVLVLERPRNDGSPGGYELVDLLRVPPAGWGQNALSVDPTREDSARGYDYLTGVQSATIDWVLALEGGTCSSGCAQAPATRAVRAAIGDGRVLDVVGVAPHGQVIESVSGAAAGTVLTTRAGHVVLVYLRAAGHGIGARVTGLPAGIGRVVAAP